MTKTDSKMERRSFIKMGLGGLAGLSAAPALTGGNGTEVHAVSDQGRKMIYRTLGKTGLRLPIVSMGVMNADNPSLVAAALDAGIIMLDTAWGYQRGRNEEMIGKVIKGRPRDSFVLATKVPGDRERKTGYLLPDADPKNFTEKFDQSLERLGLEYVDIFYLHNLKRGQDAQYEPLVKALVNEKKRGRAKFIGVTSHSGEPEVIKAAVETGVYDVVLTAYNFRKDYVDELDEAIALAAKAGMGVVAMKTQAGAFWDKEKTDPINMSAALKWALKNPNIHTAIPGFTTFDQIELDLSIMEDLTLTDQEIKDLRMEQKTGGLYCQQCDACLAQCPQQLPIPELMRGYMYAFGYKNLEKAHTLVASLDLPEDPCGKCSVCSVRCAKAFDVKDRVTNISRMRNIPADFFA
ncbi:MAG: oxidoreductase [Candidatus Aminicenantes bacterium]|nr:oxidoreductase [Candidatus Aminicenantes bacterium]